MAKDRFGYGTEENSFDSYWNKESSTSFDKFRSGKWNSKKDYKYLKNMINTSYEDFKGKKPFHVPKSSWNEQWVDVYKKILMAASQKEGAPKFSEIHDTLRSMKGK